MLDPKKVQNGQEQHENFTAANKKRYTQYDYRDLNGELFSCVGKSLEECRRKKAEWLARKADRTAAAALKYFFKLVETTDYDTERQKPCGFADAREAYEAGACKDCPRNRLCRFVKMEAYYDITYNCRGEEISSYAVGD